MDQNRWTHIKESFISALDLSEDERSAFLAGQPDGVRYNVIKLLADHKAAGDFIEKPVGDQLGLIADARDKLLPGSRIDEYLIVSEIGSGGMGTVYLATREGEGFTQRVALKLVKSGMDSRSVLKRFLLERRILASLEHPNIARLIDGGTASDGSPYFVMEYVEGTNIRKYADSHSLGLDRRLELFQKVCSAVASAHQKLIIHRDIKPSNILITDEGEPKLLDFGIATLVSPDSEIAITQFHVLTPEYASPEQMAGELTTTTADVYSLGIVLYELLTGKRPFKAGRRATVTDTFESGPQKPSVAAFGSTPQDATEQNRSRETVAEKHLTISAIDSRLLRGDLDNIILKAIRYEPAGRYQSVQELSDDIRRYLSGMPVRATADSRRYRFAKFFQRHKVTTVTAAAAALALTSVTGVALWQYSAANSERMRSEARLMEIRNEARRMFSEIGDLKNQPHSAEISSVITERFAAMLDRLVEDDNADPQFLDEVAKGYERASESRAYTSRDIDKSIEALERAINIRKKIVSKLPDDPKPLLALAGAISQLGNICEMDGRTNDLAGARQQIDEITQRLLQIAPEDRDVLFHLVHYAADHSEYPTAITYLEKYISQLESKTRTPQEQEQFVYAKMFKAELLEKEKKDDLAYDSYGDAARSAETAFRAVAGSDDLRIRTLVFNAVSRSHRLMADINLRRGDLAGALTNYEYSYKWLDDHAGDPNAPAVSVREGRPTYSLFIGSTLLKLGRKGEAAERVEQWYKAHMIKLAAQSDNAEYLMYAPEVLDVATQYYRDAGTPEKAFELWDHVAKAVSKVLAGSPNDKQFVNLLALAQKNKEALKKNSGND